MKFFTWETVELETMSDVISRKVISGEKAMVAQVFLKKDAVVPEHHHESEQIAVMLSGSTIWTIGAEGSLDRKTIPMIDGDIMVIPSNVWHSVDVLEDTVVVDILSPIGPMGVDSQKS